MDTLAINFGRRPALRKVYDVATYVYSLAMDEPYERELKILKFIFSRVTEDIHKIFLKVECDNTTILEKLCVAGLMSEEGRQSVISCVTPSDKNK